MVSNFTNKSSFSQVNFLQYIFICILIIKDIRIKDIYVFENFQILLLQMLSTCPSSFSSDIKPFSLDTNLTTAPSYKTTFSLDIQEALDSYNGYLY